MGFLNIGSGHWDPSLIFVLGGAVVVALPGMLLRRRLARPVLDDRFHLPEKTAIDKRLIIGSALFGVGWGLAGFCPGPAIAGLALGVAPIVVFVVAMAVGMIAQDRLASSAGCEKVDAGFSPESRATYKNRSRL